MFKLIVHALVMFEDKILILKRSDYNENGKKKRYGSYWDFPGGLVEVNELPQDALIREAYEEAKLNIELSEIVYEQSNYDGAVNIVFTTLIYSANVDTDEVTISKEHRDYKWVTKEELMNFNEDLVPYIKPSLKYVS